MLLSCGDSWRVLCSRGAARGVVEMRGITATPFACRTPTRGKRVRGGLRQTPERSNAVCVHTWRRMHSGFLPRYARVIRPQSPPFWEIWAFCPVKERRVISRGSIYISGIESAGVCSSWRSFGSRGAARGVAEMRGITATPFACRALTLGKRVRGWPMAAPSNAPHNCVYTHTRNSPRARLVTA